MDAEGNNLGGPCDDFAMVLYKSIMNDQELSIHEKLIMCFVRGFDAARKLCYANSKTMAARFGMNDALVRRLRADLVVRNKLFRSEIKLGGRMVPVFTTYPPEGAVYLTDTAPSQSESEEVEISDQLYPTDTVLAQAVYLTDTVTPDRVYPTDTAPQLKKEPVYPTDTPGVSQRYGQCIPEIQGVYPTDTHNNNININLNKNHKSDLTRAREAEPSVTHATSATGESFLKKDGEGEQPEKLSAYEQLQREYQKGVRTNEEIDAQIRAQGRDPNAKMDKAVAKQKFAELMANLARKRSS
jgi:hypothetical protein